MKIKKVVCAPGKTGFYFDDQRAIKKGAENDGNFYIGQPVTEGFTSVRQAGEAISVLFVLDNGAIAHGDCAAVQYSGAGGRDPLFLAKDFIPVIMQEIAPLYEGREVTSFREMADLVDKHVDARGKKYHTAIRYGVTQACLDAVAKAQGKLMAQVIADEYHTAIATERIPIFAQSGDDRYNNVDKMIIKEADVIPHGLFNHVEKKVGLHGEKLMEYVKWLRKRVLDKRARPDYSPVFHIDVYGTLGIVFHNDWEQIADYIGELAEAAKPFHLRIEGPVDVEEREAQIKALAAIRKVMDDKGIDAEIVADEWCNTFEDIVDFCKAKAGHMAQIKTPDLGGINNSIEAVLYCKEHGMGAYLGGTCNETNRSAECCAHVAMATSPTQTLAKPGMGVDEGYMIMFNEMSRILALKDIL